MNNSNIRFEYYSGKVPEKYIDAMFDLLSRNMSKIAPTGNSYDDDKAIWIAAAVPSFKNTILIFDADAFAGYFQYRLIDDTFWMDEIQFHPDYFGSGLFESLYRYIITLIPGDTLYIKAYANKKNINSQKILCHLGLEVEGENKTGSSDRFCGKYENLLSRYAK